MTPGGTGPASFSAVPPSPEAPPSAPGALPPSVFVVGGVVPPPSAFVAPASLVPEFSDVPPSGAPSSFELEQAATTRVKKTAATRSGADRERKSVIRDRLQQGACAGLRLRGDREFSGRRLVSQSHRPERTRTIWPLRTDWAHVLRGAISARTRCGRRRMGWASHRGRACLRRRRSRGASAGIRAGSPPRRDLGNRPRT